MSITLLYIFIDLQWLAILVHRIGVVGFISRVGGVAMGFFHLIDGELSLVGQIEVFSEVLIFVWVLSLVREAFVLVFRCLHVRAE